ncbi:MAG: GNAT family N-acetyltransferase [Chloroflexota bacterium]
MKTQNQLSDNTIETICLQHFYESLTCFSALVDVDVTSSKSATQVISPNIPNWLTNAVFNLNLESSKVTQAIEDITQRYRSNDVVPFWRLCPNDHPTNIHDHLIAAGYAQKMKQFLMSLNLDTVTQSPTLLDNIVIEQITTASELRDKHLSFTRIKDSTHKSFATLMCDLFDYYGYEQDSVWRHYVAIQNGVSVGYGSAFYAEHVVGLYNVGVIPEAPRKGIATSLTLKALRDAQQQGHKIATLQSSEMAQSMYEKIGFTTHFPIQYFAPA